MKERNVISSTFDSCDIVNLLVDGLKNSFLIIDEFHNLSENNINDINDPINQMITRPINRLFVSATPIKDFLGIRTIYTYEWKRAIENKYICDFNIYLPDIPEINKYIEIIQNNYTEDEIKLIRKAYNLVKSMLFNGDRRCICYLTTIEKAQMFNRMLSFVGNIFNVEIDREQIDCNTRRMKRSEIIQKFKNSTRLFILLNVHVLDEGIDIPECDSVCITQPNNNIINIVQRMCRANRIYLNKTSCNIYLWCSEKKTNDILNYLFVKTDNCIRNKIYKINNNNKKNNVTYNIPDQPAPTIEKNNVLYDISDQLAPTIEKKNYKCTICNHQFSQKNNMYSHMKYRCKIKKKNENDKRNIYNELLESEKKINENLEKRIKQLESKKKSVNVNSNNVNSFNNIILVGYGNEN